MNCNICILETQIERKRLERQRASPREHERIRMELKRLKVALLIAKQERAQRLAA